QTSWGPTGFCAVEGIDLAEFLAQEATRTFTHFDNLSFIVASARNSGGDVFVV
ncbi:MAG: GHMP kinase, partial [Methylococcales bacterium]